jgi:hypothetical protein
MEPLTIELMRTMTEDRSVFTPAFMSDFFLQNTQGVKENSLGDDVGSSSQKDQL